MNWLYESRSKELNLPWRSGLDRHILAILILSIVFFSIDLWIEYQVTPWSEFVYKDIVNIALILVILFLTIHKKISSEQSLELMAYSTIVSIMFSVYLRISYPSFVFETYFLKVEFIILVLLFALGILVHPTHMVAIVVLNSVFVIACAIHFQNQYPISKFIFYEMFIIGNGYFGYMIHKSFYKISQKLSFANDQIQKQVALLKNHNELKSDLINIIGHDLKAPINQILTISHLLKTEEEPDVRNELMDILFESADSGKIILEDIIKWANSQLDDEEIALENFPLKNLSIKILEGVQSQASVKNIRIINTMPDDFLIHSNLNILITVMRNLSTNAIKFSNKGTEITYTFRTQDNLIILGVSDQGRGMAPEKANSLLTNRKNTSTKGTDNETGSGYGLAISKKLLEKIKGEMKIESAPNVGTKIELILPMHPPIVS